MGLSPEMWIQMFSLLVLLLFSAFFSGAETALTSLGKLRSKRLITDLEGKDPAFKKNLEYWLNNSQDILITILIGNNLVNIAAASLTTVVVTRLFERFVGLERSLALGSGTAVGLTTFFVLIFGEISPKSYAKQNSEKFARAVIGPIIVLKQIFTPLIVILNGISRFFIHLFGGKMPESQSRITEEELKTLVLAGRQEGTLEETELQMLHSVFEFDETVVREIMVPRTDVKALEVEDTYEDAQQMARETGYSRFPVYEGKLDQIVGILNIKDFISRVDHNRPEEFDLRDIVRAPYFVPESKRVNQLLANFRRSQIHIAIVVDEYGGTSGIITMEDIIEQIVGEINDEYDERRDWIRPVREGIFTVDARIDLDDLEDYLKIDLPSQKYDSLGGMIIEEMGRIPLEGDDLSYKDFIFKVAAADKKRVKEVKLILPSARQEKNGEETPEKQEKA
jgi:CBS domain containing-hemolysin-like protein